MKLRYFLLCLLYIIMAPFVFGQKSTIKINEFLIEPTPQIVELINTGTEIIDLSNWYLDDSGGSTYFTIPTGTQLYPNACMTFSGSLNLNRTSADTIRLFDETAPPVSASAVLLDSFDYRSSSGSGITFQRIPDGQPIWATGAANFDKYNLTGLSCKYEPTATPTQIPTETPTPLPTSVQATETPTDAPTPISTNTPTLTPEPTATKVPTSTKTPAPTKTPTPEPTITSAPHPNQIPTASPTPLPTSGQAEIKAIYLSEVYPYPGEGETEWVELFNDNVFPVSLVDWKIDDIADGGSSPKKFSLTIPGYSYKVLDLTGSIFNNDGDDVRLLNANDSLVDSFAYEDADKQTSFGRISFSATTYCLQNSSRGYINNSCKTATTVTPTPTPTPEEDADKTPSYLYNADAILSEQASLSTDKVQQVRPTQYYQRPTSDDEEVLGTATKKTQPAMTVPPESKQKMATKSFVITSLITSFLTAGFIFIRIIL